MTLTADKKIMLYTNLVRTRMLDELMVEGFHAGKYGPFFHSVQGQEAIGVGACTFLRKDDYMMVSHRGDGLCEVTSKGYPMKYFIAEHYGKANGSCHGLSGYAICDLEYGILGMGGTIGEQFTVSSGAGVGAKRRGKGQVVTSFFGDGATGRGTFHTALLMSANWKLPVVWLCSNNGMGMWVPLTATYPKQNLADLAFGYGIPAAVVDGQDVIAVYEAVQEAANRARAGEGPSFIEFKTCRFRAHSENHRDIVQNGIRPEAEIDKWKERDPLELFRKTLLDEGILNQELIERIQLEATQELEDAERYALEDPYPDASILETALFAD